MKLNWNIGGVIGGGTTCLHWRDEITQSPCTGDPVLWLGRKQSSWLSFIGGCPRGKDVHFAEALADKFFQVFLEASIVDSLVSLTVGVRTIFFHSGECGVVLDRLRAFYLWLVLDSIKDFIDRESQWSEVLFHLEDMEWFRERTKNACFL